MWFWVLLGAGAIALLVARRRRARALMAPETYALAVQARTTPGEAPIEALIRVALTDRSDLEEARLMAVKTLGDGADPRARPALRALLEPGATFSSGRLRKAARQALAAIDAAHPTAPGALSLPQGAAEEGALSEPGPRPE